MANHVKAFITYYTQIPSILMPNKCDRCQFYIFSADSHSTVSCQKNVELMNTNPMEGAEKTDIIQNLIHESLKVTVKPDSINFTSLVDSSFRCPMKACFETFDKMDAGNTHSTTSIIRKIRQFPIYRSIQKNRKIFENLGQKKKRPAETESECRRRRHERKNKIKPIFVPAPVLSKPVEINSSLSILVQRVQSDEMCSKFVEHLNSSRELCFRPGNV